MKFASDVFWHELHSTLRVLVVVIAATLIGFWFLHRVAPPSQPVHGPVAVMSPSPAEHEIQALEKSQKVIATTLGGVVSVLERPGATVFSKATGFSPSQSSNILHGAAPHTVPKITVTVIAPTPAPMATDALSKTIYNAAYAADTKVVNETTTKVIISRQEVPTSRFGSVFLAKGGTGLSFAVWQKKQLELNFAGIINSSHISPAACVQYKLPHTSLAGGPCLTYDHKIQFNFGITEQF